MNKIFKTSLALLIAIAFSGLVRAQETSAGECYYLNYETWNTGGQPWMYIDCGNASSFNLGYEFTLECWLRIYDAQWNQKLMGKMTNQFEDGYVTGVMLQGIYAEVLYPTGKHTLLTEGAFRRDSSWVHLTTTFASGGSMIGYVNGEKIGEITNLPSGPIPSNDEPFIIGRAPWDFAFMSFGDIDEVRVWNTARSQEQIHNDMHRNITGDESGLVAYYDFNGDKDTIVTDKSLYGNNGIVKNADNDFWAFAPSYAPVGDEMMRNKNDINAIWYGKTQDEVEYKRAITGNGLSMIGNIEAKSYDYALFGHNGLSGTNQDNLPEDFPEDFVKASRTWYVNTGGNVTANMIISIDNAEATDMPLDYAMNHYTLLKREKGTETFVALAAANEKMGNAYMFDNIELENGFEYTIGTASEAVISGEAISELDAFANSISFYPNPAQDFVAIKGVRDTHINLIDLTGSIVEQWSSTEEQIKLEINDMVPGIYFLEFNKDGLNARKKFIIHK